MKSTLLLLDGLNLVRRVYEANPAEDSKDKAEGALRSSMASFGRAIRTHNPTHCAWMFDFGGHTFRHDIFPDYKIDRKPMPQALHGALPGFKHALKKMGWAVIEKQGVEADDQIGCAVHFLDIEFDEIIVSSTDKDLVCLVDSGAKVHDHFANEFRDEAWCLKKFGVPPGQLTDWLSLVGDTSDGIPGVPSVGGVTATKLLQKYGTLEGALAAANAGEITGKLCGKLQESADLALLSKQLVSLRLDCLSTRELDLGALECGSL